MIAFPRHFTLPVRVAADGSLTTIRQDSEQEVAQSVRVLLSTLLGTRGALPAYGVPDVVFAPPATINRALEGAVSQWEPRANGAKASVVIGEDGTARVRVVLPLVQR